MKAKNSNTNKKKQVTRKKSELAKKILRTVPQNEAFYFFTDIGEYTGECASSLDNFCNKIKIMELKSVLFHSNRQDFEKWIKETIGDSVLADEISNIKNSAKQDDFRTEIHRIVKQRLSQLKKILASEDALIEHF
jgi:hypothetical protein